MSDSYGGVEISAYEIPITKLDYDVFKLIRDKVSCLTSLTLAQSFIIKYNSDLLSYMPAHYDFTTVSVIINLNTNFNDGGTHFPLLKHTHKAQDYNNGDALVYSDNLSVEILPAYCNWILIDGLKFDEKRNFFNFVWNFIKLSLSFSYNKIKYKI